MTATRSQLDYIDRLIGEAYPGSDRASYLAQERIRKRLRDISKPAASELIDELQAAIGQKKGPDMDALRAERARLVARLEEIDRILDATA